MKNQLKFSLVTALVLAMSAPNLYAANNGGIVDGTTSVSGGVYRGNGASYQNVTYDTLNVSAPNVIGGYSDNTNITVNNVTVSGDTMLLTGSVYGGYLERVVSGSPASGVTVSNNSVTIDVGEITGNVYGGYSAITTLVSGANTISNNQIYFFQGTIRGGLYGANENLNHNISGNILNIGSSTKAVDLSKKRLVLGSSAIKNFATINFYLPNNVKSGDIILTANGTVDLSTTNAINTYIAANPTALTNGQNTITLIGGTGSKTGWNSTRTATLRIGSILQATPTVEVNGNNLNLIFTFTPSAPRPGPAVVVVNNAAKSISETRLTQSQMVNLATDFIVDKVQNSLKPVDDLQSFGYVGGAILKYNSGSHIDANGVNVNVGLGKNYDDFSFGGFLEYGFSTYESVVGNVEADGQSHLYGLGLFAKQMFSNKFYLASSIHGGLVESDYSRKDMDSTYDTRSPYVGLDLGMGKLVALGKNQNIDLYAKYLFGFVASDDVTLSTGEEYKFEAVKSHRAKAGLKFNQTIRNFNFIYAGLGTQYEFSNESRASFRSGPLSEEAPRPSLKGVSGIGEVGYRFRPTEELSFEIGGKYYIGKMQGLSGNAGFQYRF